jgi:outer membrane receptor protein involved in Fe transport
MEVFGMKSLFPIPISRTRGMSPMSLATSGVTRVSGPSLTRFYTRTYDRFYFNYANFHFDNRSEIYSIYGGEIGSELAVLPDHLKLFVMYSIFKGNDTELGMGPQSRTRQKFSAGVNLTPLRNFSFGCRIHTVDERQIGVVEPTLVGLLKGSKPQTTPSYVLLNINASYRILKPAIEMGVTAFNALDEDAYDYPRVHSPTAGDYGGEKLSRTVMLYLRGEF